MSNRIRKAFPLYDRVENKVEPGMADVFYSVHGVKDVATSRTWIGWLELKYLLRFPKSGLVEIPHYTAEQALWLGDRWKRQIMTHIAMGVGENIYLFRGGNVVATAGPQVWTVAAFEEEADNVVPIRDGEGLVRALIGEHAIGSDMDHLPSFWKYQRYE